MEAASAPHAHGIRIPRPRRLLAALPDERLVEHVRRGESAAFEVLYDRYSGGILAFCRHLLGSASDAEDAVQHTFIAAHADIERSGERQLYVKAWLYTIARNRCLSMLRARREQPSDTELDIAVDHFDHDVEQRADLRALVADVNKLPEEQRAALVLAEVGDLSHQDISKVLGCEAGKVKSLVFQARSALIERRSARDTPCEQIREEIATLRGGALRRSHLRHHIEACPGCAEFREDVRRQRAMLAVALPVVPSLALRANVLGAVGIGGGSAAVGTVGATSGLAIATQTAVAKLGIAAVLVAGAGGATAVATTGHLPLFHHAQPAETLIRAHGSGAGGSANHALEAAVLTSTASAATAAKGAAHAVTKTGSKKNGFTPTTGGSNGAAARDFAATRGQGKHSGITKHKTTQQLAHKHTTTAHTKHVAAPRANSHSSPTAQIHRTTPAPKAPAVKKTAPVTHAPVKPNPAPAPTTTAPQSPPAPQAQAEPPATSVGGGKGGSSSKRSLVSGG